MILVTFPYWIKHIEYLFIYSIHFFHRESPLNSET